MPEKLIMVRESELEALREALDYYACRDHYTYENGPHYSSSPVIMDDKGHVARAALAKSEATHPTPDGCGREGKHQWGVRTEIWSKDDKEQCVNCGKIRAVEGGDDG